jgi:tetratricopeptide (TPR) repeat protein
VTNESKRPSRARKMQQDEFSAAVETVRDDPANQELWDRIEELAEASQNPEAVSKVFISVLDHGVAPELVYEVGQRALRFHETWFGESSAELPRLLELVLKSDPNATWAFQRLTVAYTVAERWNELLALYDRAIASTDETARRMQLLDEAAHAAKDFAAQPDRAIDYLTKLYALDPSNNALAASLERLLERQERYSDLLEMWRLKLALAPTPQARVLRLRRATVLLEKLGLASEAFSEVKFIIEQGADRDAAYGLLEKILVAQTIPAEQRREAFDLLKARYLEERRDEDIVKILEAYLPFIAGDERMLILHELSNRLVGLGQDAKALEHYAAQFLITPDGETRGVLHELATRTRRFDRYVDCLVQVAGLTQDKSFAVDLWTDAGRVLEETLNDKAGAIELFQRVLGAKPAPDFARATGKRLSRLLEEVGRDREHLDVLTTLIELEMDGAARAELLGQAARLAARLGDSERAQKAWQARFSINPADVEAIDALVAVLESRQLWPQLIDMLRKRVAAPVPAARRRKDLVWIARIFAEQGNPKQAIETWREIERDFGKDADSIAALVDLLSKVERWEELAEVLEEAASNATAGFADIQARLGDAYRERLGRAEHAVTCYRKALLADPRHPQGLAGMRQLLGDARARRTVVDCLTTAFSESGEWSQKLEILEQRLAVAESARQKIDILKEAAELYLEKQNNAADALLCYKRAFALAPEDTAIERQMRKLAEPLGAWQVVVDGYRDTIANLDPAAPRTSELEYQRGLVFEDKLNDHPAALRSYLAAAAISPERLEIAQAAVRVGSRLGKWKEVAQVPVALFRARGKTDAALLSALESAATSVASFDALIAAMTDVLDGATDLTPALARELYTRVGIWHRDNRNDRTAAEAALLHAVGRDGSDQETFRILADLQRHTPSVALVNTLHQLASLDEQNLDPLFEAAEVAKVSGDAELERTTLQRLYSGAVLIWRRGKEATGEHTARASANFAVERLVQIYLDSEQRSSGIKLLVEAAALPFGLEVSQQLRHRAADTAAEVLRDSAWATEIYREILDRDPSDSRALGRLADLYRAEDRLFDLVAIRQQELRLDVEPQRRLELRLELVDVFGSLQERVDRVKLLTSNLNEQPGHAPSIKALTTIYTALGQHAELARMVREQAEKVQASKEPSKAAFLWLSAGELYQFKLNDVQGAIDAYQKQFALEPGADIAARLAHLYQSRGQYAVAAEWSQRQLNATTGPQQVSIALELAKTYLQAGSSAPARKVLEKTLLQEPSAQPVRDVLADLLRRESAWEPLALLLSDGATHVTDTVTQLQYLKEAVEIYRGKLGQSAVAIPSLKRAVALTPPRAPEHLELSVTLAESLQDAGQIDEAREVLQQLIEGFGRKRSPERANIHFLLAGIENTAGNIPACFAQLEEATKMDLSHTGALQMTGELARKQGDLERAERAYRALLMLLRRQPPADRDALGPAEVLFELYGIAQAHGRADQARELMESAIETALKSEAEAKRFQQALRRLTEPEQVLRFADLRLKSTLPPSAEAEVLATRADVLVELGRDAEALDDRVRALTLDPDSDAHHEGAYQLAVRVGQLPRYLDCVSALAEAARRRRGQTDNVKAAKLTLRLAERIEKDLRDLDRAAALYAKVESSGELVEEAWRGLARVARARNDWGEQRRVLERIVQAEGDRVSNQFRADALYELAEIELGQANARESGIQSLSRAFELDPRVERAIALLNPAMRRSPNDGALLELYERVAQASGDQQLLLNLFVLRSELPDCPLDELRQAIDLANQLGEAQTVEKLMERAYQLAEKRVGETGWGPALWLLLAYAQNRKQAGDVVRAVELLQKAIEATTDEVEVVSLTVQLAELAAGPGGSLEHAAQAYEWLLERDRGDATIWRPLLSVYRQLGDPERFKSLVDRTLEALLDVHLRTEVRMAYAEFLLDADFLIEKSEGDPAAISALHDVLSEDPDHAQAIAKLTELYQRRGNDRDLAELMLRQFDRARERQDMPAISELALKIGGLMERFDRTRAQELYRAALEWVPQDQPIARALLASLGPNSDPTERADILHRLLAAETGDKAIAIADELFELLEPLGDVERLQAALEQAHRNAPEHAVFRARLEEWYMEYGLWKPLADLIIEDAKRLGASAEAVTRYKRAAGIFREKLEDHANATQLLRQALTIAPDDPSLLAEMLRASASAGDQKSAIEEITRLLDKHPKADRARAELLQVRGDLLLAIGKHQEALNDFEEGYQVVGAEMAPLRVKALVALKNEAQAAGNGELERSVTFSLVQAAREAEDWQSANQALTEWVERNPQDKEALQHLRAMDTAAERWEQVARSCERLIDLETDDALAEVAIAMAEGYERAGQFELARPGLEKVAATLPDNSMVRVYLRRLYEQTGAWKELAAILRSEVATLDNEQDKLAALIKIGATMLSAGDPVQAMSALEDARKLGPNSDVVTTHLADAYTALGRTEDAYNLLNTAIEAHKRKRSPELALLQHRMARLALVCSDGEAHLKWLTFAIDTDSRNFEIADELAQAAIAADKYDLAMKALRSITMVEESDPILRAKAFYQQARIANSRNDLRRAQHWARKAKTLDPNLAEIDDFLKEIGA